MDWLILSTAAAAQARAAALSTAMGYPRPETGTERATLPIAHPESGQGAVPVAAGVWSWTAGALVDMASLLTVSERSALYTQAEMDAAGWFPPIPPPGE